MAAQILDGAALAKQIRAEVATQVERLKAERGITPRLSVILVGDDPASVTYTRMKKKACEAVGMISDLIELPGDSTQQAVKDVIHKLNEDPSVHGILVQHPVPKHLDELDILSTVAVEKDVDGISALSLGRLVLGTADFVACTPLGIVTLLEHYGIEIKGKEAVVVGRSIILGKPVALSLLERHATVTICHSRTQDLPTVVGRADILVAALGKPEFIKGDWIKPGAVVVDAGYNKVEGRDKDVGDVDFESA
ncbi:MAG: bifunctional 5,10-methylenetetrahydrofolate dehydrogenase/5,10-methenyltetrahydrofolate cyclohydrolase, partial [Armatimonadota bacterium]|nr:bifunctional 5,10-methylenetetrahydrofolate dehydrogenase/5,10-methenyltetrahydrofolate cyclohydrolase [Armatimonadota bacterium]